MNSEDKKRINAQKRVLAMSSYLEAGVYGFDENFRIAFKESQQTQPIIKGVYEKNEAGSLSFEERIQNSFAEPLIIEEGPKKFNGNSLWFCSNGDIKIFSEDAVLTACVNQENYRKRVAHYDYFSKYFRLPAQTKHNDEERIILEQRIPFEAKELDEKFTLATIAADYGNYFQQVPPEKIQLRTFNELLAVSPNAVHRQDFDDLLGLIEPELFEIAFPFIPLHGDLWTDNVLEDTREQRLWYIDWDESGRYVFFYDFFKFMWNELDVNQNDQFYDSYLRGDYDQQFQQFFKTFSLEFQPTYRKSYFFLYFLNFLLDDTGTMTYEVRTMELADFKRQVLTNNK